MEAGAHQTISRVPQQKQQSHLRWMYLKFSIKQIYKINN